MEIPFILTTLTSLVDRIVNLEKTKIQDKKTLFQEVVKPLFEELEPLALDYVDLFRKAKKSIIKGSRKEFNAINQSIQEDRDAMMMTRIKVLEMAEQIKQHIKDDDIVEFATAVSLYFDSTQEPPYKMRSYATVLLTYIEHQEFQNKVKGATEQFNQIVDEIIIQLEKSWGAIVKSYEKIKLYSIVSPKHIKINKNKKSKS